MCKIINTKGNIISYLLKSIDGLCDPVITKTTEHVTWYASFGPNTSLHSVRLLAPDIK